MERFFTPSKKRCYQTIIKQFLISWFLLGIVFSLKAQVVVGDFWAKSKIRVKGLTLKKIWNAPNGRVGLILSGHNENFEPQSMQLVFPALSSANSGMLSAEKDPALSLKVLAMDVARTVKKGYLLAYDEVNFKPILFSYNGVQTQKLNIQWEKASYLFLKRLAIAAGDTLVAVGYLEGEDGRLESRSSVLVQIHPLEGRSKMAVQDVPGQEDGFIGIIVDQSQYIALGAMGRGENAGSRVLGINRAQLSVVWENKYQNYNFHQIIHLPDGRIALVGEKKHALGAKLHGVILLLSRQGQEIGKWISSSALEDGFLDATLTIDGYLGICGYQQVDGTEVPVLWKFDIQNRQMLFSRQWNEVNGKFTRIADMPAGFLVTGGEAKSANGKSILIAVDKEINPSTFPPELRLQTHLEDNSGDGIIDPGEKFTIELIIKNTGRTAAFYPQLKVSGTLNDIRFLTPTHQILPIIYPGQEIHRRFIGRGDISIAPRRYPLTIEVHPNPSFGTTGTSPANSPLVTTKIILQGAIGKNKQWVKIKTIPTFIVPDDTSVIRIVMENVSNFSIPPGTVTFLSPEKSVRILNSRQVISKPLSFGESVQYDISVVAHHLPPSVSRIPIVVAVSASDGSVDFEVTTHLTRKGGEPLATNNKPEGVHRNTIEPLRLNPAVDIEANIPAIGAVHPNRFAVVIGISDYRPPVPKVPYAVKDAFVFKEYLTKMLGVPEGNIFFLPNATKSDLERYFGDDHDYRGKLYNMVQPGESEVVVFYSGHGAPGREKGEGNYLVPVDADPAYLKLNGYPLNTFLRNLSQLPAKSVLVVMDACFSGQIYTGISPVYVYVPPERRFPPNFAVISSTTATQPSCWLPEKGHSLFTYLFLKGLQTFQADLNGDGRITVKEMEQYLTDDTDLSHSVPYLARKLQNVEQRPHLLTTNPNLVLLAK